MSYQPRPVEALWRVRCSDGWAHGEIWTHPIGWEFRVLFDGLPVVRRRGATLPDLHRAAHDARVRVLQEGRQALVELSAEWRRTAK